jgi:hypothetical protein
VNPVGVIFVPYVFAPQLFIVLRGAEKIGRQFRAAHVIENLLFGFEPLALADVAHSFATARRQSLEVRWVVSCLSSSAR